MADIATGPVELKLKVKGDKFLYYKMKFEKMEQTLQIFSFWHSSFVWIYLTFAIITIGYMFFLSFSYVHGANPVLHIFLSNKPTAVPGRYIAIFYIIPFFYFLITAYCSFRLFSTKRQIAYAIIAFNIVAVSLFFLGMFKILEMNYAIIPY